MTKFDRIRLSLLESARKGVITESMADDLLYTAEKKYGNLSTVEESTRNDFLNRKITYDMYEAVMMEATNKNEKNVGKQTLKTLGVEYKNLCAKIKSAEKQPAQAVKMIRKCRKVLSSMDTIVSESNGDSNILNAVKNIIVAGGMVNRKTLDNAIKEIKKLGSDDLPKACAAKCIDVAQGELTNLESNKYGHVNI